MASPTGTREQLAGRGDRVALVDPGVVAQDDDAHRRLFEVERDPLDAVLERDHLAGHDAGEAVDPRDAVADLEHLPHLARVTSGVNCSISRWITELISSALNFMRLSFDQSLAKLFESVLAPRRHNGGLRPGRPGPRSDAGSVDDLQDRRRRRSCRASRSRRACTWSSSSGTAVRTETGTRLLRRSQICAASRATAASRPSRPWRFRTRRNRRTRLEARLVEDVDQDPVLLGAGNLRASRGSRRTGDALATRRFRSRRGLRAAASAWLSLLGGVDQGLGVTAGQTRHRRREHGPVGTFERSRRGRRCHACEPPWPLVETGAAGSSLMAASSNRRWSSSLELLGEHRAGDRDGHVGGLLQISARAWSRAVAMSRWARSRAASASAWACLMISSAAGLGLLLGLVEDGLDLVRRPGPSAGDARRGAARSRCGPLGLEQHVLEVLLALMQGLRERLPGEPPQHEQQADEDHHGPDGQGGLRLQRIGLAFGSAARASCRGLMAAFLVGRGSAACRRPVRRPGPAAGRRASTSTRTANSNPMPKIRFDRRSMR